MLEEKLKNLAEKHPDYRGVFEDVIKWFKSHPEKEDITLNDFFAEGFNYPPKQISFALYLLNQEKVLKRVYRVVKNGIKAGPDYNRFKDIPETVEDRQGHYINTRETIPTQYYLKLV